MRDTRSEAVVFEDEEGIRSVLREMLERRGFAVSEAAPCGQARCDAPACDLRCCEASKELAVVAVQGQRPCSGVDLAEKLLARNPPSKILLLTTQPPTLWPEHDRREFQKLPESACLMLPKPFTFAGFTGAVRDVLAR